MSAARDGIFAGEDPFALARSWLAEAGPVEPNDPNAVALATVDADGLPNIRMVLLKEIEPDGFVFYTNHQSAKGRELEANPRAALALHWKSLRRQIRVRGLVGKVEPEKADAYYASRSYQSRIGAIASEQSRPLESRTALMMRAARIAALHPFNPPRPAHWGGYRLRPVEIEFWADGAHRLHDRFRWTRDGDGWEVKRLNP